MKDASRSPSVWQPWRKPAPQQPHWGAVALAVTVAALVAGCASEPGHTVGGYKRPQRTAATVPPPVQVGVPPVVARTGPANPSERDGPPPAADALTPAQIAAIPEPVPQVEPIREGGPNKPYAVLGQSYEPLTRDVPVKERGLASWYGRKFHGRKTASGELYNMYGLTAAHRTLPIPSYVRVTDVLTGKTIIVRVNDRGPFHSARVMDLSYAAAVKLGIASRGSAEIEFERLTFDDIRAGAWRQGPEDLVVAEAPVATVPPTAPSLTGLPGTGVPVAAVAAAGVAEVPANATNVGVVTAGVPMPALAAAVVAPAAAPVAPVGQPTATAEPSASAGAGVSKAFTPFQKGYWVQLAALGKRDGVERLQQRIANELAALQPLLAVFHESSLFKLQVGPYGSREEALAAADQARAALAVSPMVIERR